MAAVALTVALFAALGAGVAFRRRERSWSRRLAKMREQLYQAALRESALNTEIAPLRVEVAELREQLEFWRDGARFAQIQDTKTRVIPR
jgi:hypothetical protein